MIASITQSEPVPFGKEKGCLPIAALAGALILIFIAYNGIKTGRFISHGRIYRRTKGPSEYWLLLIGSVAIIVVLLFLALSGLRALFG